MSRFPNLPGDTGLEYNLICRAGELNEEDVDTTPKHSTVCSADDGVAHSAAQSPV